MTQVGTGLRVLRAAASLRLRAAGLFLAKLSPPDFNLLPRALQFSECFLELIIGYWNLYPAGLG